MSQFLEKLWTDGQTEVILLDLCVATVPKKEQAEIKIAI